MKFRIDKREYEKQVKEILLSSTLIEDKVSLLVKLHEENDSLENAKAWARQKAFLENKEIDCPMCKQRIKMYHRKLNSGQVAFLIGLFDLSNGEEGVEIHYSNVMKKINFMPNDFSNLERWGLIKQGQSSGYWSITRKGILFINGEISVPEKVHIYNSKTFGFSAEETNLTESLGKRFELLDLIKDKTFYSGDKTKILK